MVYWDNTDVMDAARIEGEAERLAKGKAEIAQNLKQVGLSAADVAKATGLSLDEAAVKQYRPAFICSVKKKGFAFEAILW